MQAQLLAKIAKLPNTKVYPYSMGSGVQIIEEYPNRVKTTNIWTDRKSSVERLQEYLQSRQQ